MENTATEVYTSHSNSNIQTIPEDSSFVANIPQDKSSLQLISNNGKLSTLTTKNNKRGSSAHKCQSDEPVLSNTSEDVSESVTITPIRLSDTLKRHLEEDYVNINKKRRLTRVPAEPSAINVLEDYVRHHGNIICALPILCNFCF